MRWHDLRRVRFPSTSATYAEARRGSAQPSLPHHRWHPPSSSLPARLRIRRSALSPGAPPTDSHSVLERALADGLGDVLASGVFESGQYSRPTRGFRPRRLGAADGRSVWMGNAGGVVARGGCRHRARVPHPAADNRPDHGLRLGRADQRGRLRSRRGGHQHRIWTRRRHHRHLRRMRGVLHRELVDRSLRWRRSQGREPAPSRMARRSRSCSAQCSTASRSPW